MTENRLSGVITTPQIFLRPLYETNWPCFWSSLFVVLPFLQLLVGPVGQAESVALSVGKRQGGRRLGLVWETPFPPLRGNNTQLVVVSLQVLLSKSLNQTLCTDFYGRWKQLCLLLGPTTPKRVFWPFSSTMYTQLNWHCQKSWSVSCWERRIECSEWRSTSEAWIGLWQKKLSSE